MEKGVKVYLIVGILLMTGYIAVNKAKSVLYD